MVTTFTNSKCLVANGPRKCLDATVIMVAIQNVTGGGPLCIAERRCQSLGLYPIASITNEHAASTIRMIMTVDFPSQSQSEENIHD